MSKNFTTLERYIPRELLSKLEAERNNGSMTGERRIVTILFCDIQGSTMAASRLDPEEWADIMNGAFKPMIQPVYRYEGTVARLQGDGLLAFFGAPIAHEDDPQRAVLAGLEIVESVKKYSGQIKSEWGIELDVRVGINTGLVVVGEVGSDLRVEYTALGDAINLAARMEQAAQPGSMLISTETRKLVEPLFDLEPVENLVVKGYENRITAYRVIRERAHPGSLRGVTGLTSPLVGRELEMESLRGIFSVLERGSGSVVSVIAEAGLGKSRLISEIYKEQAADPGKKLRWLEGRVLSYQSRTPFAPFINLFERFFEVSHTSPPAEAYQNLQERLAEYFPSTASVIAPYFATMLGIELAGEAAERVNFLEPPKLRSMIFDHVARLIQHLLEAGPLVLFIEDLHWVDPTSVDLLQVLLPLTEGYPFLVIAAFRPRRQEISWKFHLSLQKDFPHRYKVIELKPLTSVQSRSLLTNLLHIEDLPAAIREKILEKAEGNPFFVEEIIRSLIESGLIVQSEGHWYAEQEIKKIELPGTLLGVITARLDRLQDEARKMIQAAAVIGREFSLNVLSRMINHQNQMESIIDDLLQRELLIEKGQTPFRLMSFKHVLTQDAAYQSILLKDRRLLHLQAADVLIEVMPEAARDIAHHLVEARQNVRAIPYLIQAGERAARAYATKEAIEDFRLALELKDENTDLARVGKMYEGLGSALVFANLFSEARVVFGEMLAAAEAADDIPMQISALNKMSGLLALRLGQFEEAAPLLERAESLSRKYGEKANFPETALIRCQICTMEADFTRVIQYMDEVIQIGRELGESSHIALGLEHAASSLVYMTRYDEGMQKALEGIEIARQVGNRDGEAWLLCETLPLCLIRNGEYKAAQEKIEQGLEISQRIGSAAQQAIGGYLMAEIARWSGEYERAMKFGKQAYEAARVLEADMPFVVVPSLGSLGMTYLEIGGESFIDQVDQFHSHAKKLLESPVGRISGGSAWADMGLCALVRGKFETAETAIQTGLNYPNMLMNLERPRLLGASALLALENGKVNFATGQISEARAFAEERKMQHVFPLLSLIEGLTLWAASKLESSLQVFERAELEASQLEMRPICLQAKINAAAIYKPVGRTSESTAKRESALEIMGEIANRIIDPELRSAYLQNTRARTSNIQTPRFM